MKAFSVLFGVWAFTAAFLTASPSYANPDVHTLASGPNVYRIEVRNLDRFEVMATGDSGSTGELHKVTVSLFAGQQVDSRSDSATNLASSGANNDRNGAYVEIDKGALVTYAGRELRQNETRDLWIHSPVRPDSMTALDEVFFGISVRAEELDCSLKNICNRRNRGSFSITVRFPKFETPPPNTCQRENTFQLTRVDDDIVIDTFDDMQTSTSERYDSNSVVLRPINAEICIASTAPPHAQPELPPSRERFWFLKNAASQRCLATSSRSSAPAIVNRCDFEARPGPAHAEKWQLVGLAPSTYYLRNTFENECLTLNSARDNSEGGPVKMRPCNMHDDQKWQRNEKGNGTYEFRHAASGKCLNVHGREHRANGRTSVYTCAETQDQRWTLIDERTANEIAPLERRR